MVAYYNPESDNTATPEVEDLLKARGVSFDRWAQAQGGEAMYWRRFRPADSDSPEIDVRTTDAPDGYPFVETPHLRKLLLLSPEDCQRALADVVRERDPQVVTLKDWLVAHVEAGTYVRFECGQEDRVSREFGPFPFVQLTYMELRVGPEGETLAVFTADDEWRLARADDLLADNNGYSDVLMYSKSSDSGC